MTDEQNRKTVEEYMNAWAKGDESRLERILDDGYKFNPPPGLAGTKQGALEMARQYHEAFPDLRMTYSNWIVQGDNVAVRVTSTGTHQGEFMGIPATNKRADITGIAIVRLRNGKVVEDISEFDQLGLLTAIGAVTPPGAAGQGPSASRPVRPVPGRGGKHEREMETGDL